jgi:hypothetical protein
MKQCIVELANLVPHDSHSLQFPLGFESWEILLCLFEPLVNLSCGPQFG